MENMIRDKNINLHGLHLYFSIVDELIWGKIRVLRIIFQW
jgi:hypothetical protein